MIDSSPLLLVLYLFGTTGIIISIADLIGLPLSTQFLLIGFAALINTAFWFLYTRHGKIFVYVTVVLTIMAGLALVPQVYRITVRIKYLIIQGGSLTQLSLDSMFVLLFMFLITFFLFALEFVIRNHAIMLITGLALLLLVPIFDHSMNPFTLLMLSVYEVGFIVVNMSERRSSRNVMTMPARSRINVMSVVLALGLAVIIALPAFIIEKTTEQELFSLSYAADNLVKDTIARLTGNTLGSSVNNGNINRGNLYQSGHNQLALTLNQLPADTLYLKGYTGRDYNDSHWNNAFSMYSNSVYGNTDYKEPFMDDILRSVQKTCTDNGVDVPHSFYYLIYDSSDPVSEMYYLLAKSTTINDKYFEEIDVGDSRYLQVRPEEAEHGFLMNDKAADIWIRSLTSGTAANIFSPYFFQNSESRIISARNGATYHNRYLSVKEASAAEQWKDNPVYELLADTYASYIQWEYTSYPSDTFSRMEKLCHDEPLTDLNEITTFILVTLQNRATYTTTPGTTPYNKDVIDYFLFDNGKGYCVHFASAAALMYRMYGIPARYVTGYVANAADFLPNENYEGYYSASLTDKSAHAWVEIFLKDYGWVPVEVTPDTEGMMHASYPGFNPFTMRSIMARHGWTFRGETADDAMNDNQGGGGIAAISGNLLTGIIIVLPFVLTGLIIFLAVRRHRRLASLSVLSCRRLFDRMMKMLHYSRLLRDYTGSEEDFAEKLADCVTCLTAEDTARIISILLEVNYSELKATKEDRDFLEHAYRLLAAELYTLTPVLKKPFFKFFHAYL